MIEQELLDRIKEKTIFDSSGCFLYQGQLDKDGYGQIEFRYKQYRVHRVSLYNKLNLNLEFDSIDSLHTCSNKNCWNPDHLYGGDKYINAQDSIKEGTNISSISKHFKTCKHGHEYSPENTYIDKKGWRRCKKCHANRTINKYHESREIQRNLNSAKK